MNELIKISLTISLSLLMAICSTSCVQDNRQDLIVYNANIYTVDSQFSKVSALVIHDGKIVAVGEDKSLLALYPAKEQIDMQGKTIIPGIIDAHCHFTGYAMDKWKVDLKGSQSFDEVVEKVKAYAEKAPRTWIYGRGWDQNLWPSKAFPNKEQLDLLFPDRPVYLKRVDGHAALVNSKALSIAGIDANTKINGGLVELQNGEPTGILIDNAIELVERVIPLIEDSLALQYFEEMQSRCFSYGLTEVHDCGISSHTLQLLKSMDESEKLQMKIYAFLSDVDSYYDYWIDQGKTKWSNVQFGGFKIYADGALGSRGAALITEYSDKPGWRGFLLKDTMALRQIVQKLAQSDLQICTHAIGDLGNRKVLEIYASALPKDNDRRWRVEHAQVVHENDFPYFTQYNIIPSVQPTHATSDMKWAPDRLGNHRMKNAYAYKKLLGTIGWLPLGTDFPVEEINPFYTYVAAVFRRNKDGEPLNGFQIENALSPEEALRGMTIWAAKSGFEENEKGSLEVGKSADFVVISDDIIQSDFEKAIKIQALQTWINGKKVYQRK